MVKGLLLFQFSPARSGAGWSDVIAVPGLGQVTHMQAATAMRAQKVTDRNISFLRLLHRPIGWFSSGFGCSRANSASQNENHRLKVPGKGRKE
jgi:hypothetical protein